MNNCRRIVSKKPLTAQSSLMAEKDLNFFLQHGAVSGKISFYMEQNGQKAEGRIHLFCGEVPDHEKLPEQKGSLPAAVPVDGIAAHRLR